MADKFVDSFAEGKVEGAVLTTTCISPAKLHGADGELGQVNIQ